MSIRLANALFNEARTVVGAGQIKNVIQVKVHDNGDVTDANDMPLNILNLGNRGDNCVTEIRFLLPEELKTGYAHFFIVDLPNELYIQKCDLQSDYASAWIESSITLSEYKNNLNLLYAAIEEESLNSDEGNISNLTEIFVSDELYGIVEQNFLAAGWHGPLTGEVVADEESIVNDLNPGDNPDHYTPMTWVNGETKLNAANMNNIMCGIDEAAKNDSVVHKGTSSVPSNEEIYGEKSFGGTVNFGAYNAAASGFLSEGSISSTSLTSLDINSVHNLTLSANGYHGIATSGFSFKDIYKPNNSTTYTSTYKFPDRKTENKSYIIATTDDLTGFITGPATNTNNAIAVWDGANSKTIKNSELIVSVTGSSIDYISDGSRTGSLDLSGTSVGIINKGGGIEFYLGGTFGNVPAMLPAKLNNGVSVYTDNEQSLGATDKRFKNLYLSGNLSDGTNSITVANIGDVKGPNSVATDGNITIYDGTTGKLIKDSTIKTRISATYRSITLPGGESYLYLGESTGSSYVCLTNTEGVGPGGTGGPWHYIFDKISGNTYYHYLPKKTGILATTEDCTKLYRHKIPYRQITATDTAGIYIESFILNNNTQITTWTQLYNVLESTSNYINIRYYSASLSHYATGLMFADLDNIYIILNSTNEQVIIPKNTEGSFTDSVTPL